MRDSFDMVRVGMGVCGMVCVCVGVWVGVGGP